MEFIDSFMLSILFDERIIRRTQNRILRPAKIDVSEPSRIVKQISYVKKLLYYLFIPLTILSFSTFSVWLCIYLRARSRAKQSIRRVKRYIRNGTFPYRFPVFLLFSDPENFVTERYIPVLSSSLRDVFEGDIHLVCSEEEHFVPGKPRILETERLFHLSSVVLVIVSADVLRDPFIKKQVDIACILRKPILLLLMEDIEEEMLPLAWMNAKIVDIEVKYIDGMPVDLIPLDFNNTCDILLELMSEALPSSACS